MVVLCLGLCVGYEHVERERHDHLVQVGLHVAGKY